MSTPKRIFLVFSGLLSWLNCLGQEIPLTFEEFQYYFEQAPITLPEPLSKHFLQEGFGDRPTLFTHSYHAPNDQSWLAFLYETPSDWKHHYHLATFSPTGQLIEKSPLKLPAWDHRPAFFQWLGDTLLEIQYPAEPYLGFAYYQVHQGGQIEPITRTPLPDDDRTPSYLTQRLISEGELLEMDSLEAQFHSQYLLAVRDYRFPDPATRIRFAALLPEYKHRYRKLSRVPLSELEKLNLFILQHYLHTGTYPTSQRP